MTDIVSPAVRSKMMSGIKGKNTTPELIIRKGLHSKGFRYRVHATGLPGKPDLVLKKYRAVIFVHGCFWHRHECHLFKWPKTRPDFWKEKINRNYENDQRHLQELMAAGWRVCLIWECSIKRKEGNIDPVVETVASWLNSESPMLEVAG